MKKKQQKKPLHKTLHHHAKLLVVPHARNKYQPHLVRWTGLAVIVALVLVLQAFYFMANGAVLGDKTNITNDQLLSLTNQEREKNGLAPLSIDARLMNAAALKANDMMQHNYWAHTSPTGATPWQWFKEARYSYGYAGENLAKNFTASSGVVSAWMNSAEHRENILDTHYQNVGFAVTYGQLDGEKTTLVVAMYGAPKSSVATMALASPTVLAATSHEGGSLVTQLGARLQNMTPAILGSIILLLGAALVAATAHLYRKKLPKNIQRSWLKHHGMYKAVGMASLAVIVVALYSGGQI